MGLTLYGQTVVSTIKGHKLYKPGQLEMMEDYLWSKQQTLIPFQRRQELFKLRLKQLQQKANPTKVDENYKENVDYYGLNDGLNGKSSKNSI